MATLDDITRDLRNEVESQIKGLKPHAKSTKRFSVFEDKSKQRKPITEFTGTSRKFEVGEFREIKSYSFGDGKSYRHFESIITFVYRRTSSWQDAAVDDMQQVRFDIRSTHNDSSVTGVSKRIIDPKTPVTIEPHAEDPWDYYTLRLLAWLEIDL